MSNQAMPSQGLESSVVQPIIPQSEFKVYGELFFHM